MTIPNDSGSYATLPFKRWYPLAAGLLAGIVLRLIFHGEPGGNWSAMTGAFIYFAPMFVGAVTVYIAETQKRRSWNYYVYAPFLANTLFVLGTLLIMIEGLICAIVIIPLFSIIGAFGGLAMGIVCRITNWPKQTLSALAVLPLALGFAGDLLPTPQEFSRIERSIVINASPDVIWQQLAYAKDISAEDFQGTWAAKIGVPMPQAGVVSYEPGSSPTGYVRHAHWDKKVHFDGLITDWQPGQLMRWTYRFAPDSFPPHALDDHVMIGGHYFDLIDTSFKLEPEASGTHPTTRLTNTRLTIAASYRVSTQFNFYADAVAQLLLDNMLHTATGFYQRRSEKSPQPKAAAAS
jgi:hypothetical protein